MGKKNPKIRKSQPVVSPTITQRFISKIIISNNNSEKQPNPIGKFEELRLRASELAQEHPCELAVNSREFSRVMLLQWSIFFELISSPAFSLACRLTGSGELSSERRVGPARVAIFASLSYHLRNPFHLGSPLVLSMIGLAPHCSYGWPRRRWPRPFFVGPRVSPIATSFDCCLPFILVKTVCLVWAINFVMVWGWDTT